MQDEEEDSGFNFDYILKQYKDAKMYTFPDSKGFLVEWASAKGLYLLS